MQYKTIILELLRQRRSLHERLRKSDTLLETLNEQAELLKARHLEWIEVLAVAQPGSEAIQLKQTAFELALNEWESGLTDEAVPTPFEALTLDDAMAFLRRHSQPE